MPGECGMPQSDWRDGAPAPPFYRQQLMSEESALPSGRRFSAAETGGLGLLLREPPPLGMIARRPYYRWLVIGTVCIGAFMGQLDASIAQLVLPVLERDFGERLSSISWVSVGYMLALAALLPVFGRLADLYGRKLQYALGFLLFIFGSALCGAASGLVELVGFRVLQAVGAALLQANSIAIVVSAAGAQHRGRAIGLQGAAQAVGLSAGPALGGFLIGALSWRWVFWINVPFGLFGAVSGWLVLPRTEAVAKKRRFDGPGALLLAPAMTALILLINRGQGWGLASLRFAGCAAASLTLLLLFIRHERNTLAPLLDLSLFRRQAFWAGNLAGLLSYAMLFGMFLLVPFVLERGYQESPLAAGLRLAVIPVALGLLSPMSGALYDRLGPRLLTVGGMTLSLGAFILIAVELNGEPNTVMPITAALLLFGIGQGLFTSPNNSCVMAAAPPNRVGQAGGILNVTRAFGTSFGVALASAVLAWRLGVKAGHVGDTLHAAPQALLNAAHDVIVMFAVLAVGAGALSSVRPPRADKGETPLL
jgi:EmrB/QacA subfamily drug resistance transporter